MWGPLYAAFDVCARGFSYVANFQGMPPVVCHVANGKGDADSTLILSWMWFPKTSGQLALVPIYAGPAQHAKLMR